MKRGFVLSFIGLLLGVLLGIGILAAKEYAAKTLMGLLESELAASCRECRLVYDSADLSLLTLSAKAKNTRVELHDQIKLSFPVIQAQFSLRDLRHHRVLLTDLRLIRGFSDGVGPESVTFRFIDTLAAPVPPERDYPGRWKLKLINLRLIDSAFRDRQGEALLEAKGAELKMRRTESDDFELKPRIKSVSLSLPGRAPVPLGNLKADLFIGDDRVEVRSIALRREGVSLDASAVTETSKNNPLTGRMQYSFTSEAARLPEWIRGAFGGEAGISGSMNAPEVKGTLENRSPISLDSPLALVFERLLGEFTVQRQNGSTVITVPKFELTGSNISLTTAMPLSYSGGTLNGSCRITSESLALDSVRIERAESDLVWRGGLLPEIAGKADRLVLGQASLSSLRFTSRLEPPKLSFKVWQDPSQDSQPLQAEGNYDASTNRIDASIRGSDLRLTPGDGPPVVIEALVAEISGPVTSSELSASSYYSLAAPGVRIDGKATLAAGKLEALAASPDDTLKLSLISDLSEFDLTLMSEGFPYLNLFAPERIEQSACAQTSLKGRYSATLSDPFGGSGSVQISSLTLGCTPREIRLTAPASITISNGMVSLEDTVFRALETGLMMKGRISRLGGYDLSAAGTLDLSTILPLLPFADDLRGEIGFELGLTGTLDKPAVHGSARMAGAGFDIERLQLSAEDVTGAAELRGSSIIIEEMKGRISGGTLGAKGAIELTDLGRSRLEIELENILFEPIPNLTVDFSGDLALSSAPNGELNLGGDLRIMSATFERTIDWAEIARNLARGLLTRKQPEIPSKGDGALPVSLNLHIAAPGNLTVVSNLFGAELSAELYVKGNASEPIVEGHLETLSGWFGLSRNQFTITSATIGFAEGTLEPVIDILGETTVRSREGDNVIVMIEVSGPVGNLRTRLSSDSGLSEREILRLLAAPRNLTFEHREGTLSQDVSIQPLPFIQNESILGFGRILRNLARIDSLSFEPTFNPQRGVFEPTVVATKKLMDRLTLTGQSSFTGGSNDAEARLTYQLLPFLKIAALADSYGTTRTNAVGFDVTLTALSSERPALRIIIEGNSAASNDEILSGIRLTGNSILESASVVRIPEQLSEFYATLGYHSVKAQAYCLETIGAVCKRLLLNISEGEESRIRALAWEGETWPSIPGQPSPEGTTASQKNLNSIIDSAIRSLRSEGYIGARISGRFGDLERPQDKKLYLNLSAGRPVTFIFKGNAVFSAADFLNTINLYTRRQPFGRNTINILADNIDRLYREAGYLLAVVSHSREEDPHGRIVFTVNIDEGRRYRVREVRLEGNSAVSRRQLENWLRENSPNQKTEIFSPRWAIAEEIEGNADILRRALVELGFPGASVRGRVRVRDEEHEADIVYDITEGAEDKAFSLTVAGWPAELKLPQPPNPPFSGAKIERYREQLKETLDAAGYFWSKAELLRSDGPALNRITVDPGEIARITAIRIEGLGDIGEAAVLESLRLSNGSPWNTEDLVEAKRRLLRLGLFSKVELVPADGALDSPSEELLVKLEERALRTLEFGGGLNSEYGLHLFGEATDRALFGDGRRISARVDSYYDQVETQISQGVASLTYADPEIFDSEFGLVEDLRFQRLDTVSQEFNLDRVSLASYLHRSWEEVWTASAGHTILQENLSDVSPGAILSDLDRGVVTLSYLFGAVNFDQRDNPVNPRTGYNLGLNYQFSERALGSDANFFAIGCRASYTKPLDNRFSTAFALMGNDAWTFAGTPDVPISQRFYLGGRSSVRGFRENSLGPRGFDGAVIGGDLSVAQNSELRYQVTESLEVHLFFDAGGVFLKELGVSADGLRESTGFGTRYLSPIGPFSLDLGVPLDRETGEPSFRLHFNIGTNF